MGQVLTKNEGFSDFCEGWVPFLLEIKQKAGWLVGVQDWCVIKPKHMGWLSELQLLLLLAT